MWREIKRALSNHERFLITTHVNPDGDGIGASSALAELLTLMGKQVKVLTDGAIPSKFYFLDFQHVFEAFALDGDYSTYQVLIILDTHRKERIGAVSSLLENPSLMVICIDHHDPTELFTPLTVIDSKACCVGAMVYTLFKECGYDLNCQAAAGIYTSIICDTGRFSYSSTDRKAHKIADECIKKGVDPDEMHSRVFQHVSLAEIKMVANSLQHMEVHIGNKVVVHQILREDCRGMAEVGLDIEHVDLEYIHDFNKMIEDVECIVLLRELADGLVRVSFRSKTNIDIKGVAKAMGGGGHAKAAGATCYGALSDVKTRILSLLQREFDKRQ